MTGSGLALVNGPHGSQAVFVAALRQGSPALTASPRSD